MAQKKIHEYDFCNVPNTEEGKLFIKLLSKYRNKDKISRVDTKGQKLKPGRRWQDFSYGYPISESETLRVYLRRNESWTKVTDFEENKINYSNGWFEGRERGRTEALQDVCSHVLSKLDSSS